MGAGLGLVRHMPTTELTRKNSPICPSPALQGKGRVIELPRHLNPRRRCIASHSSTFKVASKRTSTACSLRNRFSRDIIHNQPATETARQTAV